MINKVRKLLGQYLLSQEYISPQTANLKGQVILVTGASRGIGKAICEVLLREGATVVAVSRNLTDLQAAFKKLPDTVLLAGDVSVEKDVQRIVETITKKYGRLDILVNNAAVNSHKSLRETSLSEFNTMMDVNLKSIFLLGKAVLPVMTQQKEGLIINIGSKISHNTNVGPNKVLYATTKYGVEGFSFAFNREVKSLGIRVTCLMPGTVNTFLSRKASQFLSPFDVASVALMVIKFPNIDFESILFKSKNQNI